MLSKSFVSHDYHTPVLSQQFIELLGIEEGDRYIDATVGEGGHLEEVFKKFGNSVELLGIDADQSAIDKAKIRLEKLGANCKLVVSNFRDIDKIQDLLQTKKPTKILFDLGWNKSQFEAEDGVGRGFSFQSNEPLKMTFDINPDKSTITASDIVNTWDEENIETIIRAYGEERFAKRIAKQIVEERREKEIKTTFDLVEIIKKSTPLWYQKRRIHPATKTFQALRIAVNDELRALEEGLKKAFELLSIGGRIGVISFHSLEDRIVKRFFITLVKEKKGEILTKKPIVAEQLEVRSNPRSRSAKMRVIKKI